MAERLQRNLAVSLGLFAVLLLLAPGAAPAVAEVSEGGEDFYQAVRVVGAPFPKSRKSTLLLKRVVAFDDELGPLASVGLVPLLMGQNPEGEDLELSTEIEERMGIGYILWSSAIFEVVILSAAAWVFCRRDF